MRHVACCLGIRHVGIFWRSLKRDHFRSHSIQAMPWPVVDPFLLMIAEESIAMMDGRISAAMDSLGMTGNGRKNRSNEWGRYLASFLPFLASYVAHLLAALPPV